MYTCLKGTYRHVCIYIIRFANIWKNKEQTLAKLIRRTMAINLMISSENLDMSHYCPVVGHYDLVNLISTDKVTISFYLLLL